MDSIVEDYNLDSNTQELEIIYKKNIEENVLIKILQFLINKYNTLFSNKSQLNINNLEFEYILDIFIENISKNHRLSFKYNNEDILKTHCLNEKNNMETNSFSNEYSLEYKKMVNYYNIDDLNCKINLKKEFIEEDEQMKLDFYQNYRKFTKFYRLKKRCSFDFEDFKIDISIVKQNSGNNLVVSEINNQLEKYEIEIEIIKDVISVPLLLHILQNYFILFKQINTNGYFIINENNKNNIIKNYYKLINPNKILDSKTKNIGPKPITLTKKTIKNMLLSSELTKNLEKTPNNLYYKITEKADGERYFMYINNEGIIYLINDINNLILTGLKLNLSLSEHNKYINSILDGEYLYYKIKDKSKYIYTYKYFDIYILNTNKVYNNILENRISIMDELNSILNSDKIIKYLDPNIFIECSKKEYYETNQIIELQKKQYDYHIDGFIYMPTISLYNINNITFKEILKYKPIEENTMDVYVNNKTLYCGYNIILNKNKIYILSEIITIKPYILDFHIPKFIYDTNDKVVNWNKLNKKVIEIRYDKNNNKFIFNNIRYDKTIRYNNTNQITANNFIIINDIVSYNFNPISSEEMSNLSIDYIKEIDTLNNFNNYYKIDNQIKNKNNIRTINNLIKRELIDNSILILEFLQSKLDNDDFNYIKVLDLACGRGGDLKKFIDTNYNKHNLKVNGGIQFILGIDYDPNNIEFYDDKTNMNNNARARYVSYKNTNSHIYDESNIPDIFKNNSVYYITGDLNLYKNDDTSISEIYYKIMNKSYPDFKDRYLYDKKLLDNIRNKYISTFDLYKLEQFELISCQFAIHYFNLEFFSNFVNKHLKNYGLFICTFMNKEYVDDLMKSNTQINGSFWSLKKSSDPSTILVKFETLEDEFKEELLISKDDIINEFAKYSIKPYQDEYTKRSSGRKYDINSIFDFKNHHKLKYNSDPELEFSKLYSYIIFQKNLFPETIIKNLLK